MDERQLRIDIRNKFFLNSSFSILNSILGVAMRDIFGIFDCRLPNVSRASSPR
jgi:hypothetical protein